MKWFKHHSDMSMNDKIGKLEDKFGLVGYAAYLKILEMCALNWDEKSEPIFSFSLKQIKNKLRLKSKQTDIILGLMSDLNLFQISKSKDEVIIKAPKLAEIKKRHQKKDASETSSKPTNDTPNKKGDKDKEKEGEGEREVKFSTDPDKINFSQVVDLFNSIVTPGSDIGYERHLQKGAIVTDFVKKQRDLKFYQGADWEIVFSRMAKSTFISKKLKVKSHLEWILKENNLERLLKGDFDNRSEKKGIDEIINPFEIKAGTANG